MNSMNSAAVAADDPATSPQLIMHARRPIRALLAGRCSHCDGTGREPAPLAFDFSLSGERRGELNRLSERTGLAPSTVSRALSGSSVPSLPSLVLIAEALEVSESRIIHSPPVWMRLMAELNE